MACPFCGNRDCTCAPPGPELPHPDDQPLVVHSDFVPDGNVRNRLQYWVQKLPPRAEITFVISPDGLYASLRATWTVDRHAG